MSENEKQHTCPTCNGNKVIEGICETSSEWQGKSQDGQLCTPDQTCPTCNGSGVVK